MNDIVIKAVAVALRNVPEANGNDISLMIVQVNFSMHVLIGRQVFVVAEQWSQSLRLKKK